MACYIQMTSHWTFLFSSFLYLYLVTWQARWLKTGPDTTRRKWACLLWTDKKNVKTLVGWIRKLFTVVMAASSAEWERDWPFVNRPAYFHRNPVIITSCWHRGLRICSPPWRATFTSGTTVRQRGRFNFTWQPRTAPRNYCRGGNPSWNEAIRRASGVHASLVFTTDPQ